MNIALRLIAVTIALLPVIAGLVKRESLGTPLKFIWMYCLCSLIADITGFIMWKNRINNMPLFHFFTMVEFSLIILFYKEKWSAVIKGVVFNVSIFLFLLLCIINILFFQTIFQHNTYTRSLEAVLLIIISLISLYFLLRSEINDQDKFKPVFFVSIATLIYFSGALLLFILSDYIGRKNSHFSSVAWTFHAVLNIAFYSLLSISIWKQKKA